MRIVEHAVDRIVEVTYQETPLTALEHAAYTIKMKQIFEKQNGGWGLLVDQRPIPGLDAKLKDKMVALYGYALKRGMICSARIVQSPRDANRLRKMIEDETTLQERVRIFTTRHEAFDWLRGAVRGGD